MKNLFLLLCWTLSTLAFADQAYMDRFNTYYAWYQQLPTTPSPQFLDFIKQNAPLSNKLRDKWLYELARIKDWKSFTTYYQSTQDLNLVCFKQLAEFNLGNQQEALKQAIPLWLSGNLLPIRCNTLFDLLLKRKDFDQNLITQRIAHALDKQNIALALYLLKQYKIPQTASQMALTAIHQNPLTISKLEITPLNSYFYLYGLKRMVSINMDKAVELWNLPKTLKILNLSQQQDVLAHIALYKAMRNNPDTLEWFAKVKPNFYPDVLLDWRIRFALKNQNWVQVIQLIEHSKNKQLPCWQYWLARSYEELDKKKYDNETRAIYEALTKNRHYYGFLASIRLKQKPNFANETPVSHFELLKSYQPLMNQVKALYQTKQILQASRLLNDFISELPKDEASALVYWVDSELKWYGKSVYLSNNETLNNQLSLRFPLAYKEVVSLYAKKYAVEPELVYAIIRQESGFREDAVSSAGAKGLMQLMPYTAGVVSKAFKIPYSNPQQLFLSQININIGIAYLQQLAKRFGNHPVLVAAAYNAGPKQVVYWLKNHPPKEIDLWIETLPWQETRNYLKNIMAFYVVYQYRLEQKPDFYHFLMSLNSNSSITPSAILSRHASLFRTGIN